MKNISKLNLLHDLAIATSNRKSNGWNDTVENVEIELAVWINKHISDDQYLPMPCPSKLTYKEMKWIIKVIKA